jgi:uncharacterized protein (DUF305 family)
MSNHHSQAVDMAEIMRDRTEDPQIRILATDIALTQQAQIGQLQAWLDMWKLPATSAEPAMSWMGHPTEGRMPGMATPEEINNLRDAPSKEADEQFLRLMIPHHQAAVMMAEDVQERSNQPQVVNFAQKTITAQQAEIEVMQDMLQSRGLAPVEGEVAMPASDEEGHHGQAGFLASVPKVAHDTGRLAPLPLAVFAAGWLVLETLRRRRVQKGKADPAPSPLQAWQAVAVGGLVASAVLHIGLAPSHFEEAISFGVFFSAASLAAAIIAAAILAWPSRPAYLAGVGISLALIVLWGLFRIVPPPGAEAVEEIDLVGLFTKATELVAATACTVLLLRARRVPMRTERDG